MSRRHWEEAKHPRDRIGRFADHPGGGGGAAWAERIAAAMPAPAATKTKTPPANTIDVPLGKLKIGDTVWHDGREWAIGGTGKVAGVDYVELGYGGELRKITQEDTPTVRVFNRPLRRGQEAPKGRDAKRMARWRKDTLQPGRTAKYNTQRDYILARETAALQEKQIELDYAIQQLMPEAKKKRLRGQALQDWLDDHTAYIRGQVHHAGLFVDHVKNSDDPVYDEPPQPGADQEYRLAQKPDPKRPLAVYGDMLHIGGGQNVYDALAAMEDTIPWEIHTALADFMAKRDNRQPGGVWLSSRAVSDMNHSHDLKGVQPRGWGDDKTWDDVNGVHRPNERTALIGLTDNTYGRRNGTADTTRHELGHALDHAFGDASRRPAFTEIHEQVKKEAQYLKPYFRQAGTAGAQEFWAEAFHVWSSYRESSDGPIAGFMFEFGVGEDLATELVDYYNSIYSRARQIAAELRKE